MLAGFLACNIAQCQSARTKAIHFEYWVVIRRLKKGGGEVAALERYMRASERAWERNSGEIGKESIVLKEINKVNKNKPTTYIFLNYNSNNHLFLRLTKIDSGASGLSEGGRSLRPSRAGSGCVPTTRARPHRKARRRPMVQARFRQAFTRKEDDETWGASERASVCLSVCRPRRHFRLKWRMGFFIGKTNNVERVTILKTI